MKKEIQLHLPDLMTQRKVSVEEGNKHAIKQLRANLKAPVSKVPLGFEGDKRESDYPTTHLLRDREGWEAPHEDIVGAYFRQFQAEFEEYKTDKSLAALLGVSSDRRIRDFKQGSRKVPYGIWRRFLNLTGRAPQDVVEVMAFFE